MLLIRIKTRLVGYSFVDASTIIQVALSYNTTTEGTFKLDQKALGYWISDIFLQSIIWYQGDTIYSSELLTDLLIPMQIFHIYPALFGIV